MGAGCALRKAFEGALKGEVARLQTRTAYKRFRCTVEPLVRWHMIGVTSRGGVVHTVDNELTPEMNTITTFSVKLHKRE